MMRCPLPIDWLEHLEGAGSSELASHLSQCRSCQILVDQLRREKRPPLRPRNLPSADSWPRWTEVKDASPQFGDIWWTSSSLRSARDLQRIPVLVFSEPWHEQGHTWCEAVPLSSDVENATSLDLVMLHTDSDINVPWRALLRHQTIVDTGDLESRIGRVTTQGQALLRDVLDGRAPQARFGPAIESAEDTRAELPELLNSSMRLMGRAYAELMEGPGQTSSARVLTFPMRPLAIHSHRATAQVRLAASTSVEREHPRWEVDVPHWGHLKGRVDLRFADDELLFVIESVEEAHIAVGSTAWVAVWSDRLSKPVTSAAFDPSTDRQVVLGKGLEMFPQEITRLEFRLSDET